MDYDSNGVYNPQRKPACGAVHPHRGVACVCPVGHHGRHMGYGSEPDDEDRPRYGPHHPGKPILWKGE